MESCSQKQILNQEDTLFLNGIIWFNQELIQRGQVVCALNGRSDWMITMVLSSFIIKIQDGQAVEIKHYHHGCYLPGILRVAELQETIRPSLA